MGQSASSSRGIEENGDGMTRSGVSLSPEFQEQILNDFENQSLNDEWNKFRRGVLQSRDERTQKHAADLERIRQETAETHSVLHEAQQRIESSRALWTDGVTALEYDINRVSEKYRPPQEEARAVTTTSCLGERAHWMDCAKKYVTDARPCDAYVSALEKCVHNTIVKASLD